MWANDSYYMIKYYCHKCSAELGLLNSVDNLNLTGSDFQLSKYLKHTIPNTQNGLLSTFDSGSYAHYRSYVVNTMASGSVEIDHNNNTNVVWYAGKETGVSYLNGNVISSPDTVKVVLSHDDEKIHAYPTCSNDIKQETCENCGEMIVA